MPAGTSGACPNQSSASTTSPAIPTRCPPEAVRRSPRRAAERCGAALLSCYEIGRPPGFALEPVLRYPRCVCHCFARVVSWASVALARRAKSGPYGCPCLMLSCCGGNSSSTGTHRVSAPRARAHPPRATVRGPPIWVAVSYHGTKRDFLAVAETFHVTSLLDPCHMVTSAFGRSERPSVYCSRSLRSSRRVTLAAVAFT